MKLRVAERVVASADQRPALGRRFGVLFDGPAVRRSKTPELRDADLVVALATSYLRHKEPLGSGPR